MAHNIRFCGEHLRCAMKNLEAERGSCRPPLDCGCPSGENEICHADAKYVHNYSRELRLKVKEIVMVDV